MTYRVNEIFYSLQGEGARAGTANVFVRFSGCNLQCRADGPEGFDCDTEFTSGQSYNIQALIESMHWAQTNRKTDCERPGQNAVILTGGEPTLQVDRELLAALHEDGWYVAIETNGVVRPGWAGAISIETPDWISCSPKTAEHTLKIGIVDELRYVRNPGMGIPKPKLKANYHCLSPAAQADGTIDPLALEHCIKLCLENPQWRLSVQQHKTWRVR